MSSSTASVGPPSGAPDGAPCTGDWATTFDPKGTLTAPRSPVPEYRFARRREAIQEFAYWKVCHPAAARRGRVLAALLGWLWRRIGRRIAAATLGQRALDRIAAHLEQETPPPADPLVASPLAPHGPPVSAQPALKLAAIAPSHGSHIGPHLGF